MADLDIGDAIPFRYTITAAATVALTVTAPDGTVSTPTPTQTGSPPAVLYTANVTATQAGIWLARFDATGAVTDSEDIAVYVRARSTARVYATLPELKARLSIPTTDTQDDGELQRAIETSSREIDQHCQRHFWTMTDTRTLVPTDVWCLHLGGFGDLVSVTTLKTDASGDGTYETTWAAADYQLLCADGTPNTNAGPEPRPYTQIMAAGSLTFPYPSYGRRRDLVQVIGVWGWPSVPSGVRDACMILTTELFALKDTKFGAVGFNDLGIIRVRDNPKVMRLLAPYQRRPVLVA